MNIFQKIMINCWITVINIIAAIIAPSLLPLRLIPSLHSYYNYVLSEKAQVLIYFGLVIITFIWMEWCWIILQKRIK